MSQELIEALGHPLRRRLLRFVIDHERPVSSLMASRQLKEHPSNVNYHLKRLADIGLIRLDSKRPVRGATEYLYLPDHYALDHPVVQALLDAA